MKKIIINIFLIVTFIIMYLLQVNFFNWFTIAGIMPNLFIILALFIGLYFTREVGITYGIIIGTLLDLFIGKKIGISCVMYALIGLIGGIFDKNFSKESRFTIMIMVLVSTIIFEFGSYILGCFIYGYEFETLAFLRIMSIESVFNMLITIIIYPLIQNIGYTIEEEYKGNKILTRYF